MILCSSLLFHGDFATVKVFQDNIEDCFDVSVYAEHEHTWKITKDYYVSFKEPRHIYKLDDFWRINEIYNDKNAFILMCKVKAEK